MQQMVSLHQVQRMHIQYFSHSHNIQQTAQVGARLADGTHQTGYTIYVVQAELTGETSPNCTQIITRLDQRRKTASAMNC